MRKKRHSFLPDLGKMIKKSEFPKKIMRSQIFCILDEKEKNIIYIYINWQQNSEQDHLGVQLGTPLTHKYDPLLTHSYQSQT